MYEPDHNVVVYCENCNYIGGGLGKELKKPQDPVPLQIFVMQLNVEYDMQFFYLQHWKH